MRRTNRPTLLPGAWLLASLAALAARAPADDPIVDFRYSPPEWQSAICLPDDPSKSLVDKSGELLYHYGQGGREFATRVGVEVVPGAAWKGQALRSPRVPIVETRREGGGLEILEEAFAVTDLRQPEAAKGSIERVDGGGVNRSWAKPQGDVDPRLADIALHNGGSIRYRWAAAPGGKCRVALAICEGWWDQSGKRVQVLRVEGAAPRTVDGAADPGKNKAAAYWFDAVDEDGDGAIRISVDPAPGTSDTNTILNGLWVFAPEARPDSRDLLAGKADATALARMDLSRRGGPARNDLILVRVKNTGAAPRRIAPRLIVDTTLEFRFEPGEGRAVVDGHETVTSSPRMVRLAEEKGPRRAIQIDELTVPAGGTAAFHVLWSGGGSIAVDPTTVEDAAARRDRAVAYWEGAPLPFGRVQVPDAGIQALVDSSIRNIWQAREIKEGLPVFQVGPTCYRGLWIVDGAFLLEAATLLGAGKEARSGVAYTLLQQKPSGAFEVLSPWYYKENGIVLWTCVRHALLTQDKAWLESVWPALEKAADWIRELRKRTLANDSPLDDGLIPAGEIDGGLSGAATGFKRPEYTNVYWSLHGLKALVEACRWLGKDDRAAAWQSEYDDFQAAFRKAAARDLRRDPHGSSYLPIMMANAGDELPQRAQWAFCQAVYPGQIFDEKDPLVAGNLAMLEATEREGMVWGTGWDATGIWNYFASFYGHAWLWRGNGRKAGEVLYAFANHASPVLNWREEQSLVGEPYKKVGDMPHNWASAEFIRLTIHLLSLDRGDELHLLEGLPAAWTRPGMVTRLDGVATRFGPLRMELRVADDGRSARLRVRALPDPSCARIVAHLGGWASAEAGSVLELDPKRDHDRSIPIARAPSGG